MVRWRRARRMSRWQERSYWWILPESQQTIPGGSNIGGGGVRCIRWRRRRSIRSTFGPFADACGSVALASNGTATVGKRLLRTTKAGIILLDVEAQSV